jgi:hypothetical protein
MRVMQRIIYVGFATAALASASLPALSWTVWPDIDFEWYAQVGRPLASMQRFPAPREGYIWAPGHWEARNGQRAWAEGRWIRDDYPQQVAAYAVGAGSQYAGAPMTLGDIDRNPPLDSNRR